MNKWGLICADSIVLHSPLSNDVVLWWYRRYNEEGEGIEMGQMVEAKRNASFASGSVLADSFETPSSIHAPHHR